MSLLVHMGIILPLKTSAFSGGDTPLLAREVFPFPPSPPSFPQRACIGEKLGVRGDPATKDKLRVYSLFILSIEIIFKISVNSP